MKKLGVFVFVAFVVFSFSFLSITQAQQTTPQPPKAPLANSADQTITTAQIQVPDWLEAITRVLFGVKQENIDFSLIIILLSVAALLFVFIYSAIDFVPFFEGKLKIPAAIIITLIVSITGAVRIGAQWLIDLAKIFSFLERWSIGALLFVIVVAIICIFFIRLATTSIREIFELKKAGIEGDRTGRALAFVAAQKKAFGDAISNNRSV